MPAGARFRRTCSGSPSRWVGQLLRCHPPVREYPQACWMGGSGPGHAENPHPHPPQNSHTPSPCLPGSPRTCSATPCCRRFMQACAARPSPTPTVLHPSSLSAAQGRAALRPAEDPAGPPLPALQAVARGHQLRVGRCSWVVAIGLLRLHHVVLLQSMAGGDMSGAARVGPWVVPLPLPLGSAEPGSWESCCAPGNSSPSLSPVPPAAASLSMPLPSWLACCSWARRTGAAGRGQAVGCQHAGGRCF